MNTKSLFSAVILGGVASLFVACGDGDSTKVVICNAKQVTCLTDQSGQVCSADETEWLSFSCNEGEVCGEAKAGTGGSSGDAEGTGEFGCQGACVPEARECGSEAVSRVCSGDGKTWLQVPCAPGTGCDNDEDNTETYGTCVRLGDDDPSVTICDAGEITCADATTVKACELDRSGWRYTACAANEVCEEGEDSASCVVDETKGCVPHSGTCMDLAHVRYCSDEGDTYDEIEECPPGTTCAGGACQGPVCPVGAVRCSDVALGNQDILNALFNGTLDPQKVYTCNSSGTAWELSSCEGNAICIYDNISAAAVNAFLEDARTAWVNGTLPPTFDVPASSRATCEVPDCAAPFAIRDIIKNADRSGGSFTCGDPTAEELDFLGSFSLCEGLAPYVKPHWANYLCPENTQCSYTNETGLNGGSEEGTVVVPTCSQACHPGTIACYSDILNGGIGEPTPNPVPSISNYGEYTIECDDEGNWDLTSVERCVSGNGDPGEERELWCGPNLQGGEDHYNIGQCMEPACVYLFSVYDTFILPPSVGACGTDGNFYTCTPEGRLEEDEGCERCVPNTVAPPETYAGYVPGSCRDCVEGEQTCLLEVDSLGNGSPFYSQCVDGEFELRSCAGAEFCRGYTNLDHQDEEYGIAKIICGGDCAPFTTTCVDEDGFVGGTLIQECDQNGVLKEPEDCVVGACHQDEQGIPFGGTAHCEAECIDGTTTCFGNAQSTCDKGRFPQSGDDLVACEGGDICVERLGCTECRPGTVVCDSLTEIKGCNENGEYDDAITCPGDNPTCVPATQAYCAAPTEGSGGTSGTAGTSGDGGTSGTAQGGTAGAGQGGTAGDVGQGGTAGDVGQGGTAAFSGVAGIIIKG